MCGCDEDTVCPAHEDHYDALFSVPCSFCGSDGHSGDQHAHEEWYQRTYPARPVAYDPY